VQLSSSQTSRPPWLFAERSFFDDVERTVNRCSVVPCAHVHKLQQSFE
jgi:hypothetical protein